MRSNASDNLALNLIDSVEAYNRHIDQKNEHKLYQKLLNQFDFKNQRIDLGLVYNTPRSLSILHGILQNDIYQANQIKILTVTCLDNSNYANPRCKVILNQIKKDCPWITVSTRVSKDINYGGKL